MEDTLSSCINHDNYITWLRSYRGLPCLAYCGYFHLGHRIANHHHMTWFWHRDICLIATSSFWRRATRSALGVYYFICICICIVGIQGKKWFQYQGVVVWWCGGVVALKLKSWWGGVTKIVALERVSNFRVGTLCGVFVCQELVAGVGALVRTDTMQYLEYFGDGGSAAVDHHRCWRTAKESNWCNSGWWVSR